MFINIFILVFVENIYKNVKIVIKRFKGLEIGKFVWFGE